MADQTADKPALAGVCEFCQAEIAKSKMTQHLKSCKERRVAIAELEKKSRKPKQRLFHIVAEDKYRPEYWLHLEMPASEPLWTLDGFLKDIWIEDLDHLSGFEIDDTTYSDDTPSDFYLFSEEEPPEEEEEEEEELTEEELAKNLSEFIEETISSYSEVLFAGLKATQTLSPLTADLEWVAWTEAVKKPRSLDDLIGFLKIEQKRIRKEERSLWRLRELSREAMTRQFNVLECQKLIVGTLLDNVEDTSMGALLQRVLKVGQKFSYIYDYGSSTYISLRVVAEREGIVQYKKEPVKLLARNVRHAFPCVVCGKPATVVTIGYYDQSIEENAYCDECAEEHIREGGYTSLIDSPRDGIL